MEMALAFLREQIEDRDDLIGKCKLHLTALGKLPLCNKNIDAMSILLALAPPLAREGKQ